MLKTLSKWLLGVLVFVFLFSLGSYFWLKKGVNSTFGADTELVDHKAFAKPMTVTAITNCLLYTSPSPRDKRQSRMPSSA